MKKKKFYVGVASLGFDLGEYCMSRDDRMKASDVHKYHPLAQEGTFKEVFPQIKSMKMTVSETGHLGSERHSFEPRVSVYDENHFQEWVDCSNPKCKGGVWIGKILLEMVHDKKPHLEIPKVCSSSEKGSRYSGCTNFYEITVDVEHNH